jgi:predicted RNA polymerase sigma factor
MTAADAHRAILAVWRIEQPRLITSLARMLRDVPLAEDLTQEALLAALERWPATGVPEKPGAWLMATAKRRALDHLRRGRILERKHEMVAQEMEAEQQTMPDLDSALDDDIGDEMLRLLDQNRALWDQLQIRRGMQALGRACELGGARGFYALQAAIIACHAQAETAGDTDWSRIAGHYTELAAVVRSPIVELNRAVAVGMAEGPEVALAIVDRLVREPALKGYHLLLSVRGDLLHKLGRHEEARAAFEAAAAQVGNRREHDMLRRRAAEAANAAMSS